MSLLVWLPLNGDLRNIGCSNTIVTNYNDTTVDDNGKIEKCYSFNGTNNYLQLSNFDVEGLTELSISFWCYPTNVSNRYFFLARGDGQHRLRLNSNNFTFRDNNNSSLVGVDFIYNIPINTWTHVTAIYNHGKAQLYVNGTLDNESSAHYDITSTLLTLNTDIRIGRQQTSSTDAYYAGKINDFRIYDHALSAAEVKEIAQGLVLHYKLDDITNGVIDNSGYGHNGTIVNTPSLVNSQARYTSNIHFFANNQHIQLPAITYSNFGNSFTIAWWGKRSTHSKMMFWGFSDGNRLNGMYNGTLWNTGDSSNNPIYEPGTTTTITAPTATLWHHYVMIGNGTKSQLYVDGVLYGEAKTYKGLTGTSIWINGWRNHTEYSSADMDISDFRIYCTAISADAIRQLYEVSAKIDKGQNWHTFECIEDSTTNIEITKTGQTRTVGTLINSEYYDGIDEISAAKVQLKKTNKKINAVEFIEI